MVSLDQTLSSVGITPRAQVVGNRVQIRPYLVTGMVGSPANDNADRAKLIMNLHEEGNLWCEPEDPGMTLEQGLGALAFTEAIEIQRRNERKAWKDEKKQRYLQPMQSSEQNLGQTGTRHRTGSQTTGELAPPAKSRPRNGKHPRKPGSPQPKENGKAGRRTRTGPPTKTTGSERTTGNLPGSQSPNPSGRTGRASPRTAGRASPSGRAGKAANPVNGDLPAQAKGKPTVGSPAGLQRGRNQSEAVSW